LKHESKLQTSNFKEENMEAWKHGSKLQNRNLKEESTGSTGIIIYHGMISASSTDHGLEILRFEIQLSSRLPKVICTISLAYTSP
jgi:hypothetical protein